MGDQNFDGQKPRDDGQSGAGQSDQPPAKVSIPGEKHDLPTRRFQSDDDLIHVSRSDGLKISNR